MMEDVLWKMYYGRCMMYDVPEASHWEKMEVHLLLQSMILSLLLVCKVNFCVAID